MTPHSIDDLTRIIAEDLGLDDTAAVEEAVRRHRADFYEAHTAGSEALEALERTVWHTVTDGAEWPW